MIERIIGIPNDYRRDVEALMSTSTAWPASDFDQLHEIGINGERVFAAHNDTGVTVSHPAFKSAKIISTKNYISGGTNVADANGHGTSTCSMMSGLGFGAATHATLRINQVLGANGSGSTTGINRALIESAQEGFPIVNASLGGPAGSEDDSDRRAIEEFYDQGGELYIAAAGNAGYNGANTIGPPGSYVWPADSKYGVCTVGATRQDGSIANFSSGGKSIDVATPGEKIPGAGKTGGTVITSGTSNACPIFTGLVLCLKQKRARIGLPRLRNYKEWMNFMKTEGFLFDAGAPGFDPRFGYGVPVISKIMAWLKTPVGVMIFCALMAIQLPAQELTIQIAPKSGTITYQQADEAKVYPASGGVVIVSKGLSKQQGVGEIVIVDGATGPYGIFATDQSKIGFNPVPLILLEPDQWLILGVSGQKFMIVVTRFKDGVFTYDFKEVVIGKTGGDAPPPVDPPTDNLAEWQATARDRAVLVNDKPTAAALGASYIRNAALLTGVDLNEAYRRIEASTGDTLADRKGVSADVNWNVYLTYMEDKLQKAGVTTVGQYAKIVDAWGKGLLEASK